MALAGVTGLGGVTTGAGVAAGMEEGPAITFMEAGGRGGSQEPVGFHVISGVEGLVVFCEGVSVLSGTPCNPRTNLTRDCIWSSVSAACSTFI